MKNGDYIRNMDNDRLCAFLWTWAIDTLSSFMEHGGQKLMHAGELREWLEKEEFVCEQTKVGDDFVYDQDFRMKGEDNA